MIFNIFIYRSDIGRRERASTSAALKLKEENMTDLVLIGSSHAAEQDLAPMVPRILVSPHNFPVYMRIHMSWLVMYTGYSVRVCVRVFIYTKRL